MNIQNLLHTLLEKKDLTREESGFLLSEIMKGAVSDVVISAFLTALAMKGETVDEIIGFIQTMKSNMVRVRNGLKPFPTNIIDVCGTGGDGKNSFNISTAVAFVVAGAGVAVAKHGNRAASSLTGSADVLEKLGVHITLTAQQAEKVLQNVGMVFLFAPLFHPAMKSVSLIRKELKIRTIFNYLGPFVNPAKVTRQLIGVPNMAIAEKLAQVGKSLGYEHLIIATSEDGLDEVSIAGKTYLYEVKKEKISRSVIDSKVYGFDYAANKIDGGDVEENAMILKNILDGEKGSKRDIVVINSAVALYVAGKVSTIVDGIHLAQQSIDTGKAREVLEKLVKETQKYA
jgi:anthranilate phosphoribosyltransferase